MAKAKAKPINIYLSTDPAHFRTFVHEPSGTLYPYRKRGALPKFIVWHGPNDIRREDGTPLDIHPESMATEFPSGRSKKIGSAKPADKPVKDPIKRELTEYEQGIRVDLKGLLAGKDSDDITPYLEAIPEVLELLLAEWREYQEEERKRMKVTTDRFLNE